MEVVSIVDEGLGHTSWLVGLGDGSALVVDPARFPNRQQALAAERGWRIAWVADTHSHADYVSGSPELAADGATFLASAGARLEFPHRPVEAGEQLELSPQVALRAIATPGHTPDHLAYLLTVDGEPAGLWSGGSLMVGTVGRTDLLGDELREDLARRLFRSLRSEILVLPDDLPVYPTHGAGSFCSAPAGGPPTTTIGIERETNPLLGLEDEDRFVEALMVGLGTFPTYFRQLPEFNRRGPRRYPRVPDLPKLGLDEVLQRLDAGALLVDARPVEAFAAGHAVGSLSIPQRPVFGTWLGWLVDSDRPVIFLLDRGNDRPDIMRQCLTIGHDAVAGEVDGGIEAWFGAGLATATVPLVDAENLEGSVLDVRQTAEWMAGHVPDAAHVELGSLTAADLPDGAVTVMCGHGERAITGASVLLAAGRGDVRVLTGGPDDWAAATGGRLATG